MGLVKVSIRAIPESGYIFTGWEEDAEGKENPIELIVDSNKSLVANFKRVFDIDGISSPGGFVSGGSYELEVESITRLPRRRLWFAGWEEMPKVGENPIELIVDSNKSLVANFKRVFDINGISSPGGFVSGGGSYELGEKVTLKATQTPVMSLQVGRRY